MDDVAVCDSTQPGLCPAVQVDVKWDEWWEAQLKWPLVVQLSLTAVFLLVFEPLFVWAFQNRSGRLRKFVKTYLGTSERPEVPRPMLMISIYLLQIFGSLVSVAIWVSHTYQRSTWQATRSTELAICLLDILTWIVNRLWGQCKATSLWELNGLVDALTIVPTLQRAWHAEGVERLPDCDWLSLQFLRSYQTLFCFARIQETGHMQYSAVLVQMCIQVMFQVYCLLTVMAGTIFTCEVLGDPPVLADSFIETHFGDRISFMQMVYWVMISVTTVGYGDFAPRTMAARILTAVFIVIGVAVIFWLEFRVSEFVKRRWEGSGSYRPRSRHDQHVVVVLCLSGAASKVSSMIAGFLQEILHTSHDPYGGEEAPWWCSRRRRCIWPHVVIFSPTTWDDMASNVDGEEMVTSFNDFLKTRDLPRSARGRVSFIVGKVSSKADLDRAAVGSSTLTFLMPDVNSECPDEADGQNIFAAVMLRNLYPSIRLRVMLLRPESKELAVQAGVPVTRCFSSRELKANILAQNVRCHGLVPMITGMLCSAGQEDEEYFLRTIDRQEQRAQTRRLDSPAAWLDQEAAPQAPVSKSGSTSTNSLQSVATVKTFLSKAYSSFSFANEKAHHPPDRRVGQPRNETFENMKLRLRSSSAYFCKNTGEYEACDPWMFAYFGGLRRSVQGFELSEQYAGLTFGELVHAVFRDTEALVIGIFKGARLQVCPQQTHKNTMLPGQLCFAVVEKPEQLDPVRQKGKSQHDWRTRLMTMSEQMAMSASFNGAHLEAAKLCGHQLANTLVSSARPSADLQYLEGSHTVSRLMVPEEEDLNSHNFQAAPPTQSGVFERRMSFEESWGRKSSNFLTLPQLPDQKVSDVAKASWASAFEADFGRKTSGSKVARQESATLADDADALLRIRNLRRTLGDYEELVVLIVCHGEVWQQVRTFVTCFRSSHLPVMQPVVVLVPCQPPPGLLEDCGPRVVIIKGNHLSARVLLNIGIVEASAVVVMNGEGSSRGHFKEPIFKDYQVMLVAQELECWCGISEREVFTTYELQDSRSVRYLPFLLSRPAMQLEDCLEDAIRDSEHNRVVHTTTDWGESEDSDLPGGKSHTSDTFLAPRVENDSPEGNQDVTRGGYEESVLFHPRFAAGQVFTPEIWGSMLGRAFYNPAIIETVEALVMPHRRGQAAFPWQIRVPPMYVGRNYEELVRDMALGGWDRSADKAKPGSDEPRRFSNAGLEEPPPSNSCYIRQPPEGPAVPVALYRVRDDIINNSIVDGHNSLAQGTGGHNYNILAPPPATKLRAEDWVLVIGSHRFGRKVFNLGLLRGSSGAVPWGQGTGENGDSSSSSVGCERHHFPASQRRKRTGIQGQGADACEFHDCRPKDPLEEDGSAWKRSLSDTSLGQDDVFKQGGAPISNIQDLLKSVLSPTGKGVHERDPPVGRLAA